MRARVGLLILACLLLPGFTETTLTQTATPANLVGTLTLPEGARAPGVLILPGASDRNGNRPGQYNDSLKLLAHGLAECGVASLRVDPRGIGDSTQALPWDLDSFTVDITEADAMGWLAVLRTHARSAAVLGYGEGGLTAAHIGASAQRIVLLGATARPAGEVLRARTAQLGLSAVARARINEAISQMEAGKIADDPPPAVGGLFRLGQTYLISLFKRDPLADLRTTRAPALVVDGTTDLETIPQDAARLAAARPGVHLVRLAFMNHVLRVAAPDWSSNMLTYARPDLPLAPGLLPTLCGFLSAP